MAAEGIKVGEQLRTYKGLPVKKNTFVESWYNKREDMEMSAVITNGMLFSGFVWGLAVPYFAYEAVCLCCKSTAYGKGQVDTA